MNNIFCLETDWVQSLHGLKRNSSVQPLLNFISETKTCDFVYRNVATNVDFEYYINHLIHPSYRRFRIVYLCFHGAEGSLHMPNKDEISLSQFADDHIGIFKNCKVHFGSCETLNISDEEIKKFKKLTKGSVVTGYIIVVVFVDSVIFELWLMNLFMR